MSYKNTVYASYIGYITQAVVINFTPLLFLTLKSEYGVELSGLSALIALNFITQLTVDLLAARFAVQIGYRPLIIAAHIFCGAGLSGLVFLPELFENPFVGLAAAVFLYAIGGGLIEVLISPIVEALPNSRKKAAAMSLLHSFYCWGQAGVILLSTLFFSVFGLVNWRILAVIWAFVPFFNSVYFLKVPIYTLTVHDEKNAFKNLLSLKIFWVFAVLMMCAGAAELGISQWASAFAESGLKISKSAGDIAGPCVFALLMGVTRTFYAKYSDKIDLRKFMTVSGGLCAAGYLLTSLSPIPVISLIGCAVCGLSVGIMWPGTFSMAAVRCRHSGTAMFALLALFGDFGCSVGPALVGFCGNISTGLLLATVFPIVLTVLPRMLKTK
jgi:MFS family permease